MTSREIVERLINEHIINGEEAFTLINDICKNEMYDVWKTLEGSKTYPNLTWQTWKNDYSTTCASPNLDTSISSVTYTTDNVADLTNIATTPTATTSKGISSWSKKSK